MIKAGTLYRTAPELAANSVVCRILTVKKGHAEVQFNNGRVTTMRVAGRVWNEVRGFEARMFSH